MSRWLAATLFVVSAPALGADLSVGVGLGVAADMKDKVSKDYASFAPGPSLTVPVRYGLSDAFAVRVTPRIDISGPGEDRVTWAQNVDGQEVRIRDDDHFALFAAAGATVGPEVVVPTEGKIAPYFGAEAGVAWVGTYHSLGGNSTVLLDPNQNDLKNSNNIDPFTTQLALLADLHGGARYAMEGMSLNFELGYSNAYLGEQELTKTPAQLKAMRAPYGWNALKVGVGVQIPLGG